MRVSTAAVLVAALGCGESAPPEPAVHVVLLLDDPAVSARADEIDAIIVEIEVQGGLERIDKTFPVPAGTFADGESDFDFVYGDRTDVFDLYVTAGVGEEAIARGQAYEIPIAPHEVRLPLDPFTNLWTSPEEIDAEAGEDDGSGPRVVVDDGSLVTVVWTSGNDVGSNGGAFGGGWAGAATIATGPGPASRPRLAIDDAGDAYLVWQQLDAGAESAFALRRAAGGAWPATPEDIDYDDTERALVPEIAVDGGGTAIATFVQTWYMKPTDEDRRSIWGGFWSGTEFLDGEPLNSGLTDPITESSVALDETGRAFVLWQADGAGIFWNHYAAGEDPESRPSPYFELDPSADAALPRVASDGLGNVFAAWSSEGAVHASREDAQAWVDTELPQAGEGTIEDVEIVADGRGGAAVAFVRGGAVWAASWDGSAWIAPTPLAPSESITVESDVAMASDGAGVVLVVFVGDVGGRRTLWETERTEEGWTAPAAIATANLISAPHVAVNTAGNAVVVWEEDVAGRTRIRASLRGL